ncbi:hypothetical protein IAS59_002669 [Cryptococcus gattii]
MQALHLYCDPIWYKQIEYSKKVADRLPSATAVQVTPGAHDTPNTIRIIHRVGQDGPHFASGPLPIKNKQGTNMGQY